MDKMEKVELIREKTGVSYEDAREALDASDGDVLDAIVWLERRGKTDQRSAHAATGSARDEASRKVSQEMIEVQATYADQTRRGRVADDLERFWLWCKRMLRRSWDIKFIAERHGERVVKLPLLILIVGIFFWGATIWLLIIGLFLDMRYRVEGVERVSVDVNDAMDRAADIADRIKEEVSNDE